MSDVDPSELETLHDGVAPSDDEGHEEPAAAGVIPSEARNLGVMGAPGSSIEAPSRPDSSLPLGMTHSSTFIVHRLIAALWFGSGFFLILAASAAFRAAADPFTAANVVGAMLTRWHYLALFAPVALLLLEWRRQRNRIVLLLFIAIILAALESTIDVRIAAMRERSIVPISSLSPTNPLRRQFGMLHGLSTLLLLADVIAAGAIVLLEPDNR